MLSSGDAAVPRTTTLKVQLFVLPEESVATAVTTFVPIGNAEPVPGVTTRFVTAQLSVALLVKFTTTGQTLAELVTMSAGQPIVGFSVSSTVTVKLHETVLVLASITVKLLVVIPFGKAAPLGNPPV
jgi:hypothetical protein